MKRPVRPPERKDCAGPHVPSVSTLNKYPKDAVVRKEKLHMYREALSTVVTVCLDLRNSLRPK